MEFKSPVDVVEFRDTTKDLVNRIQIGTQKPKHILGREEKNRGPLRYIMQVHNNVNALN